MSVSIMHTARHVNYISLTQLCNSVSPLQSLNRHLFTDDTHFTIFNELHCLHRAIVIFRLCRLLIKATVSASL